MLGNWVRETTTTTGTGNLTVASVSGYPTFNNVFSTTQRFRYIILNDSDGTPIEAGIGYLSASTTLVRAWVTATYSGGTYAEPNSASGQVSLASGTKRVVCGADASALVTNPMRPPILNHGTANSRLVLPANYFDVTSSALTITGARLYVWPVLIQHRGPFDGFAVRANATGANLDMALYRMLDTGLPGALVAGVTGVASAAGLVVGTLTAFSLTPGWYCMAFNVSSGTTTYYQGQVNEGYGRSDTLSQAPLAFLSQTQGTLPDPFGTPTTIGNNTAVPALCLRAA